jgi:hypothetical protein
MRIRRISTVNCERDTIFVLSRRARILLSVYEIALFDIKGVTHWESNLILRLKHDICIVVFLYM